jgi:signal recognition particle subunit SRP54
MFHDLTNKLDKVVRDLRGQGKLTEKNISDSLREIRRALLAADVNYKVVKKFISLVQEKALGTDVLRSVSPGQMLVKVVHDELIALMGGENESLRLQGNPAVILLAGLQGSGKTTLAGKLAVRLAKEGKKVQLVGADVYRPAAREQLRIVAEKAGANFFTQPDSKDAVGIAAEALRQGKSIFDVLIIDTAGRLHVDAQLMDEIAEIHKRVNPSETLFVADGMTGQDAINTADAFRQQLDFDGVVLTKMDGDARGGAALSIRAVTGKPIKFISTGEQLETLEPFHPERMASRILGKGDVVSLVEKAQEAVSADEAKLMQRKLRRQEFNFEDFFAQLQSLKKMGPLDQILGMIPGLGKQASMANIDDNMFVGIEAIINSMTNYERRKPKLINGSRRKRIANGSGRSVQEVNQLLKQFFEMQKMMKKMSGGKGRHGRMGLGQFPAGMKMS